MNNEQEIIARALEIAITLTGANHECLRTDDRGFVGIQEPLFSTLQTVIKVFNATSLIEVRKDIRAFRDFKRD